MAYGHIHVDNAIGIGGYTAGIFNLPVKVILFRDVMENGRKKVKTPNPN